MPLQSLNPSIEPQALNLTISGIVSDGHGLSRDSVLTFSPLSKADTGDYKCSATYSNLGTVTSAIKQLVVLREYLLLQIQPIEV